jgi:hypothetical protein
MNAKEKAICREGAQLSLVVATSAVRKHFSEIDDMLAHHVSAAVYDLSQDQSFLDYIVKVVQSEQEQK